ncbi:hypothetical protein XNC3_970009 [Xenorhabdus nematophila F1]|nr:hypothetical protein XNC3_970009 [Xenorhabdus nematophila F1]
MKTYLFPSPMLFNNSFVSFMIDITRLFSDYINKDRILHGMS